MTVTQEGHDGVFASVQVLQVHPSDLNCYILLEIVEIPVSTIVTILPQMDSWTRHVYKTGGDGSLTILSDNVSFILLCYNQLVNVLIHDYE